jgi:CRP-like cAMP-binding protein
VKLRSGLQHSAFANKLRSLAALSPQELAEIGLVLPAGPHRKHPARTEFNPHDQGLERAVLMDGFAYRYRSFPDGARQILSLILPGDFIEPIRAVPPSSFEVCAPVDCVFRIIPMGDRKFHDMTMLPGISLALARGAKQAENILYQRIALLGRKNAAERIAGFFCETFARMDTVAPPEARILLPLTQVELADALGLSFVHVNRVLQSLRRRGVLSLSGKHLELKDQKELAAIAGWEPDYLLLRPARPVRTASRSG